jgi:tetratricopeptide (TPR) repeat protein
MDWGTVVFASRRVVLVLSLYLAAGGFAGEALSPPGGDAREGWERLNLSATTLAGMKVYYERALEPNLPAFERELAKYLARRDERGGGPAQREQIVADLNRILGVTEPNLVGWQREVLASLAGAFSGPKLTLCLARTGTIKDYLRGGGQLPDFHYDRPSDMVEYTPQIQIKKQPGAAPVPDWELWIAIRPQVDFAGYVSGFFESLGRMLSPVLTPVALHEVTEMTLLRRARPTDAHWRWFSDGFANAITCTLVEKYLGPEAGQKFARAYDPNGCRALEKQINLWYWMLANYCPYSVDVPVKGEADLEHARYAYATFEAQRLIAAHEIGCVRAILNKIAARDTRTGLDLLQVIQEVTGEDIAARLLQYQAFTDGKEASEKYVAACKAAMAKKDYEQAFVNLMRVLELHPTAFSASYLQEYSNAAVLLFQMDHEEAADAAMQNCIELYSRPAVVNGRQAVAERFLVYCLQCGKPRKGEKMADELLAIAPDNMAALVLKMRARAEAGDTAAAQDYARKLRRVAKQGDPAYRAASKVLGLDPNTPPRPPQDTGRK